MANTEVLAARARGLSLHLGRNGVGAAKFLQAGGLFHGRLIDDGLHFDPGKFNGMPASRSPNRFVPGQANTFLARTPFSL